MIEPKETLTIQLSSNETHMRLKFASFPQTSPRLFCQILIDYDLRHHHPKQPAPQTSL